MIGDNGILYQKDLGDKTVDVAAAITEVNPGDGWTSTVHHTCSAARTGK